MQTVTIKDAWGDEITVDEGTADKGQKRVYLQINGSRTNDVALTRNQANALVAAICEALSS